jgi:hypothetical protein
VSGVLAVGGEDVDGVVAVEALAVPVAAGGVGCEVGLCSLDRRHLSDELAGVYSVGHEFAVAAEVEAAVAAGHNRELAVVVAVMVAFAEQYEVVQVGSSAVDPVPDVMGLEAVAAAAAGVAAVPVAQQQGLEIGGR